MNGGEFLIGLGLVALAVGLPPILDRGSAKQAAAKILLAMAALFMVLGLLWGVLPGVAHSEIGESISKLAAKPEAWLAILLASWLYWAIAFFVVSRRANEFGVLIKDMNLIHGALSRWLYPRGISREQEQVIDEHLKQFAHLRVPITIEVRENDPEASGYAGRIQKVLMMGEWPVTRRDEQVVRPGLAIQARYTPATNQEREGNKPHTVVVEAFQKAGIMFGSRGSGSGVATVTDDITITVGERRRDESGEVVVLRPPT